MKIPARILHWLQLWAHDVIQQSGPDQIIGNESNQVPLLERWYIHRSKRTFNIYLHHLMRSDDDRALHDHPWWNCSIILRGEYIEHTIAAGGVHYRRIRRSGDIVFRRASGAHRLELNSGACITLFMTGPKIRDWGFHCPSGWVFWKDFVMDKDGFPVHRGCGD